MLIFDAVKVISLSKIRYQDIILVVRSMKRVKVVFNCPPVPNPTAKEEILRTWQIFVELEKLLVLLAEVTRTASWTARIKKHCASWNSTMMDFAIANRCEMNRLVDVGSFLLFVGSLLVACFEISSKNKGLRASYLLLE
jgi:hypothetical protein